jgi:phage tail sheath protein FI
MPVQLSYPGVYVQELPSGVRTITGVPTAITAFIGRTAKGPTDVATVITSYADFERTFGGLAPFSSVSFAVRDYFLNGGSTAVIVRLYKAQVAGTGVKAAKAALPVPPPPAVLPVPPPPPPLMFQAANEGTWGRGLRVAVDTNVPANMGVIMGVPQNTLFNLAVTDVNTGQSERFTNLTTSLTHASRVDLVLAARSSLLRCAYPPPLPPALPPPALPPVLPPNPAVIAGKDPVSTLEDALEAARRVIPFDPTAQAAYNTAKGALDTAIALVDGNDGDPLTLADSFLPPNARVSKKGLYALDQADLFNILCIPPYDTGDVSTQLIGIAASYCEERRAFYVVDPPAGWVTPAQVTAGMAVSPDAVGTRSKNAALYWPRLIQPNPFKGDVLEAFVGCGAIAGVMARTDGERGVWKAPAGLDAILNAVPDLAYRMTDGENGLLNPIGVNALRIKAPNGRVVYGARTLQGDDRLGSEYKYVPVRRLALYIEESAYRGTQWVVFEPNDEPLWAQIRLNLGAFMHDLFRKGAFQGKTKTEAYFVKCDSETTTQNDINLGIVNIVLGFAPLKPAEFVVISLKQIAGTIEV